ncbi:hypothetical protein LOTGIDRAFT_155020 [Lottia gigantea]|uniref:Uncharacterized protein n=1 Tax=Lottia gigantea TaxID=225164 RepID=V3ZSI5_LOTGI|nr:hypothetical protein LOTGIDRAFT_155020 [Lottia gigantea]ESO85535.1 hypothetical protein LOTGIDRAFT_155020 [Lottia gigantea]
MSMIIAQTPKTYFGSDIQKSLSSLPGFPWAKYPGEKHLPGHNYTGPDTKKPNTTAWINKAKPYFVDQIGDKLQGDLDMNNFTITNLKLPENDYDAVHKKYLMDQLNLIKVNKEHLKERTGDVKDDKITKQKIDLKQLIANINPGISEDKLTTLETKLIDNSEIRKQRVGIKQQLLNVVDKTQLENLKLLISKLDD